jgi:uracil-DNA glycosylase family 4
MTSGQPSAPRSPDDSAAAFATFADRVRACRVCATMAGRVPVLSQANGDPRARVLFVAEAPGRRGAEVSRVPLSRDQTGRLFEQRLQRAGLTRGDIFISNAVLCNPRDVRGLNRTPTRAEQRACAHWLAETIALLDPLVVVTLGAVALDAVARLAPHDLRLRDAVGIPVRWHDRWLVPLYHPSPRAALSRTYAAQDADFARLGNFLCAIGLLRHPGAAPTMTEPETVMDSA